jgi:probable F420-dependent oxidoreductase
MTGRWGLTVPQIGAALAEHAELYRALPGWGYTDAWSSEVSGFDAFTPLALAAAWESTLQLGTAIVPAFTRGPALIAQSAAALAAVAPGRFTLGLGSSSPAIVGLWNGIPFEEPYRKTRDVLRFVRAALAGEKVSGDFDTFSVKGFRLDLPPEQPVPIVLAALRPQMLSLAGGEADGVILNWLAPADVPTCLAEVANPASTVVARIFVVPTEDADYARTLARRLISSYLTVGAYADFHRWLGHDEQFAEMWKLWAEGDRVGAAASLTDDVIDSLVLHGTAAECRKQVQSYVDAGVQVPVLAVLPTPEMTNTQAMAAILSGLGPAAEPQETASEEKQ